MKLDVKLLLDAFDEVSPHHDEYCDNRQKEIRVGPNHKREFVDVPGTCTCHVESVRKAIAHLKEIQKEIQSKEADPEPSHDSREWSEWFLRQSKL